MNGYKNKLTVYKMEKANVITIADVDTIAMTVLRTATTIIKKDRNAEGCNPRRSGL